LNPGYFIRRRETRRDTDTQTCFPSLFLCDVPLKPGTLTARRSSNQMPVAHTCNPGYSGGRDQEDGSSKSA
jgi:hypothetical protein